MEILFIMIPLAMLLALVVGLVFVWAVNHEQFDDMQGPANSILHDDDRPEIDPGSRS